MISQKYFCDSAAIGILEKKLTKLYEKDEAEKSFSVLLTQRKLQQFQQRKRLSIEENSTRRYILTLPTIAQRLIMGWSLKASNHHK